MNGSRIASRSGANSVSLPAQSLRAASSAGSVPDGHAAASPFAIDTARSESAGLAAHAAYSATMAMYVDFIASSRREQGYESECIGIDGERSRPHDVVDGVRRRDLRDAAQRELHDRHVRLHGEHPCT